MEKTLILLVTKNGACDETKDAIDALKCPNIAKLKGLANLPKARSLAFDQALKVTEGTEIDTVLCVDDDMVFTPKDVHTLVDLSRARGELVSAAAVSQAGVLAARPWEPLILGPRKKWLTGLALMAIPLDRLRFVSSKVPVIGGIRAWCQTGAHPRIANEWIGEDLWFCLHFDGVELAPISIGHMKWMSIRPDEATLRRL